MELPQLNEQHRRVAEEYRAKISRLIAAPILRALDRADTRLADAINEPRYERIEIGNVEAPAATERELEL